MGKHTALGQVPAKEQSGHTGDLRLYSRLLGYAIPYWYIFVLSMLGYIVYSLGNVLLADLMRFLLDALNDSDSVQQGLVAGVAYSLLDSAGMTRLEFARVAVPLAIVLLASTRAIGFFVGTYFINYVARTLIHQLRCQLFNKMLVLPSSYYERHSQGVLISKITYNVEQVSGAVSRALKIILREGLTVIALLSYMLYLNWRLCLVFIAVAPLIALVVSIVGKRFRRYSRRIQSSMGDVTQVAGESMGGYREVRVYGGQAQQRERFELASQYNRVQSLKLAFAEAFSTPVIQTLLAISLATLVWFALNPDILAGFSAGSLVAFLTAAAQLGKPIRSLSGVLAIVQRGLAAAEDVFAQLDEAEEVNTGHLRVNRVSGRLEFRDLQFTYPGSEEPVLHDIAFTVEPGETVALVGRSGSGKSTLVQLLARLYEAPPGAILLDNEILEDYELNCLREQIALVSQDVVLFHDTIYNNVAYGSLAAASVESVDNALESAYATQFIQAMPDGLATMLGDDGGGLSGGQRQRIAIARAILKDAPILILDEATSALDTESEYRVQQAMEQIMQGRTTLVIAHRLSTVERADKIVVMDRGRVVALGSHQELLHQGGLYAQLYHQEFVD
ncbi:MAG: lipid A export permease/ATP-binding protein MsbA [Halioglobus sp.]